MKVLAAVVLGACLLTTLLAFQRSRQYEYEMQNPTVDPPDADEKTEYAFARLRYQSGGWGRRRGGSWATDSNKAERQFVQGVRRLTRIHTRSAEEIIDIDSDEVYNWPWLYAVEVGHWSISDTQAKRLRDYLDRGGFLMVDDFHGTYEWEAFLQGIKKVFPDRPIVDIEDDHAIFNALYDLHERVQVPGRSLFIQDERTSGTASNAKWRAIFDDKGRIRWPSATTWTWATPGNGPISRTIPKTTPRWPIALASTTSCTR